MTTAAQRLALDPLEIGPIRLVGVGYSGLTAAEQFTLFDSPGDTPAAADPAEEDFDSAFDGAGVLVRAGELPDDVHDGPPIDADETGDPATHSRGDRVRRAP